MDSAHEALIRVLGSIREQADLALKGIEQRAEQKSLAWKCVACGHTKRFTRPVSAEVAAPCPKYLTQPKRPLAMANGLIKWTGTRD
jgi:predicted  nucleic acid-binding Zn ribbon protein